MNELEKSIKLFNAIFTKTTDDMNEVNKDIINYQINKENCVSLYELMLSFNNLHSKFINEYDQIEKLDLGKKVDIDYYEKKDNIRKMRLLIDDSKITDEDDVDLYIFEDNGNITSIVTDAGKSYIDGKEIELDKDKIIKLLDLFEEYHQLFDLYKKLNNKIIVSNGPFTLFTQIGDVTNDFTDSINSFKVNFGTSFMNEPGDHFRISMRLADELDIDQDDCKIYLDGKKLDFTEEDCMNILKQVYINCDYLEDVKEENIEKSL